MSDVNIGRFQLQEPEVLDLVEADRVSDQVASTQRELTLLEREAEAAVAAAMQAEEAARTVNIDTAATTWTIVRLQRFLGDLRSEAERDAQTMLDVARYHAQMRIEDARTMAARGERFRAPLLLETPPPVLRALPPPVAPTAPM